MIKSQVVSSFFVILVIVLSFQNCGQRASSHKTAATLAQTDDGVSLDGTSSGNPTVQSDVFVEPFNGAEVVFLCVDEIRMKPVGGGKELQIKNDMLLELNSNGTSNSDMQFVEGTYNKLQIELDDTCDIQSSVQIVTASETRATDEEIELKFNGVFTIGSDQKLNLNIQSMISATEGLTDSEEIAEAIENIQGNIDND